MSDLDRQLLELAGSSNPVRRNQLLVDTYDPDRGRRPERLRKLVRAGANIDARDGFDGASVVHILAQMGDIAALDAALELGADPHATTHEGETGLHVIAESKNFDVLCRLLDAGLDPNARSHDGETPLHEWAYWGNPGGVRELLDRGADPNARREDGMTPLHLAAIAGAADNVRTLLDAGSAATSENDDGKAPLDLAREHSRWEVAKILADHTGARVSSDDDPTSKLEALARKLGEESARSAIDSGDWDYYVEEDLDPNSLGREYWDSNHVYVVEDAYDALNKTEDIGGRGDVLSALFNVYYQAFAAGTPDW